MPDISRTIHIEGDISKFIESLEQVNSKLDALADKAKLVMPSFDNFKLPQGGTLDNVKSKTSFLGGSGKLPGAMAQVPAGKGAGGRSLPTPSPSDWVKLAESYLPVESEVSGILKTARTTGSATGKVLAKIDKALQGAFAPIMARLDALAPRQTQPQPAHALPVPEVQSKPTQPANALASPSVSKVSSRQSTTTATAAGGATPAEQERLAARLQAAGATQAEAAQAAGLPAPVKTATPKPTKPLGIPKSVSQKAKKATQPNGIVDYALGAASSAAGPLGAAVGIGSLAAGVAFGMQFAPKISSLAQSLSMLKDNSLYRSVLSAPSVQRGLTTPTDVSSTMASVISSGRIAKGANAWVFALKDATAAAGFARAVGLQPTQGGSLLSVAQAAGATAPGKGSQYLAEVFNAAKTSGMPTAVYSEQLQGLTASLQSTSIPKEAPQYLANVAALGSAAGVPALSGNRVAGTLSAYNSAMASGSLLQGLPGPIALSVMKDTLGHTPHTVGQVFRAYEGGISGPKQFGRLLETMRTLYSPGNPSQRNYYYLDQLLKPLGGYGSASATKLEKNVLGASSAQFQKMISKLETSPSTNPKALQQAEAKFVASYGGKAVGITSGLEVAGGQTFAGLAGPLNALSGVLRHLQGPVQAIALELGAGLGLQALGGLLRGGGLGGFFPGGGGGGIGGAGVAGGAADGAVTAGVAGETAAAGGAAIAGGIGSTALDAAGAVLGGAATFLPPVAGVAAGMAAGNYILGYPSRHPAQQHLWGSKGASGVMRNITDTLTPNIRPTASVSRFVKQFAPMAKKVSQATGLSKSFVLGEWANETNWGSSKAFVLNHNLEGLKPYGGLVPGKDSKYAGFSGYKSFIKADIATLTAPRYAKALKAAQAGASPRAVASLLHTEGFATSPTFAQTVAATTREAQAALRAYNNTTAPVTKLHAQTQSKSGGYLQFQPSHLPQTAPYNGHSQATFAVPGGRIHITVQHELSNAVHASEQWVADLANRLAPHVTHGGQP